MEIFDHQSISLSFNATLPAIASMEIPPDYQSLSVPQQKLLSILPIPSAIISFCASLAILVSIKRSRFSDEWTPYHGLLAGMTLCNIIWSMTLATGNFLYDQETSYHIYAYGNEHTCTLVGFMNQFAFTSAIPYMACFSFYFLLTTRYEMNNSTIASKYETKMHVICLGYGLMSSFLGLFYNAYHERSETIGCWVRPCDYDIDGSPTYCLPITVDAFLGRWLPTIVFIVVSANNVLIRGHVRRNIQHEQTRKISMAAVNGSPKTVRISTSSEDTNGPDTKLNDDSEARESSNRREDRENQKAESKRRRLKLLRIQSLYFVITFLLILSPTSLLRFLIAAGFGDNVPPYKEYMEIPYNNYWLMVLQAFVFPLQSCANMLIYLSPKYATIRRHYSQETRWWAIRRTIFGASIRPSGGEDVSGNRPVGISISDFKSSRVSNTDNRMKQGRASIALAGDFFA